ncbi:MAG: hypothetical protein FJY65_08575, partial [Calditrichaeota bacterium]|nr:hypothetical protein [Calditrichota bacterium]
MQREHYLFIALLIIGIASANMAFTAITVNPFGFAADLEEGGEAEVELVFTNTGEDDVTFEISYHLVDDDEARRAGPRRDNLGDVIGGFNVENANWFGLTWDGEWMWGITYSDSRMIAVNAEGEVRARLQAQPQSCTGLTWDGEAFWTAGPNTLLTRFDRRGNTIRTINVQGNTPRGVTWDGENLWYANLSAPIYVQQVTPEGRLLRNLNIQGFNNTRLSVVWVPEHRNGHLWAHHTDGPLYQLNVEDDNPEIVQQIMLHQGGNRWGIDHDGENLWYATNDRWICFDDGIIEFHMLIPDPSEGIIPGNESIPVNILIQTEGAEAGVYNIIVEIKLSEPEERRDDPEQSLIEMSAVISVGEQTHSLAGLITDLATGEAVDGVKTDLDRYRITRFSDEDGFFEFNNLPPDEYELTFTASDYLLMTHAVDLQQEDVELNIALLHATCEPDVDELFTQLEPGGETDMDFSIANNGNGPLAYRVERRLLGEANAAPWKLRRNYAVGNLLNDDRIEGVAFDGDNFFVSGAAGQNPNAIYVVNREGERVDAFVQPGESNYGMKDLEWDGELLWGSGEQRVFGFDREGQVQIQFQGPFNPNQAIAFDPVNNILWVCATTNNIVGYDRQGQALGRVLNRRGLRIYGLAYWRDDPQGYPLYILHSPAQNELWVHKMRVDNGDTLRVRQLPVVGSPGGAFITNTFDVYSWVFMSISNIPRGDGNDRVDIYQLDARREWFTVAPEEGVIEAGDEQEFNLHLSAAGLPAVTFEGELVFLHDGVGSLTRIPVTLDVVEGRIATERRLQFARGWNLISTNLQPDNDDIRFLMR